jgi:hypothetical protein
MARMYPLLAIINMSVVAVNEIVRASGRHLYEVAPVGCACHVSMWCVKLTLSYFKCLLTGLGGCRPLEFGNQAFALSPECAPGPPTNGIVQHRASVRSTSINPFVRKYGTAFCGIVGT